jgi:hypothetical protein
MPRFSSRDGLLEDEAEADKGCEIVVSGVINVRIMRELARRCIEAYCYCYRHPVFERRLSLRRDDWK